MAHAAPELASMNELFIIFFIMQYSVSSQVVPEMCYKYVIEGFC